jgi:hypothetical protein
MADRMESVGMGRSEYVARLILNDLTKAGYTDQLIVELPVSPGGPANKRKPKS